MTRKSRVIDTDQFADVVAEALQAYKDDPTYAVSMARQAAAINKKRAVWQLRLELREAERAAVEQCSKARTFVCDNTGPCGTGPGCKFASGDLVFLELPPIEASSKTSDRPQPSNYPSYSIEQAVRPLQVLRDSGK